MKDIILWISLGINAVLLVKLNKATTPTRISLVHKKARRLDAVKQAIYTPKRFRQKRD
jgi:hypothetical protein